VSVPVQVNPVAVLILLNKSVNLAALENQMNFEAVLNTTAGLTEAVPLGALY
jgi:uncharacterized spore protein YtfJ